jgi:hypothetical protein
LWETWGPVGEECLGANGKGNQLEGRPRQGLYGDNSNAGAVPVEGRFSTCDVEGLGIEISHEQEGHQLGYTAGL